MADDKSKTAPQDAQRVNVHEAYEVQYWTKRFGCTPDQLKADGCGAHTQFATDLAPTEALPSQFFDFVPAENRSRSAYRLARFGSVLTGILQTSHHTLTNG